MISLQQQQQQQQQQQINNNNPNSTMTNANYVPTSNHPSTTAAEAIIAIAYDPEISPIPDQQAYAILDLYGNIIRSSNPSTSSSSTSSGGGEDLIKDAPTLYRMIVESTSLVLASASESAAGQEQEEKGFGFGSFGLNRMTITFDNAIRYIIARDENHIYLIQTTSTTK